VSRPSLACVGAGRLARALLPLAAEAGYPVVAIAARRSATARALSRRFSGARATGVEALAGAARLLLVAVPDRHIAGVAERLAAVDAVDWSGCVVLHHAGALGTEPLRPLARAGAEVGVLHPLQTLGRGARAAQHLPGSRARLEGSPGALRAARRLARDVGLVPLGGSADWSAADRALYHAVASMVSNDVTALVARGTELLESLGVPRRAALDGLTALAAGTVEQARADGLEAALTGPLVRGDVATVEAQLRALRRRSRAAAELHARLLEELLRAAEAAGAAPPAPQRRRLRALLRAGRGPGRTV